MEGLIEMSLPVSVTADWTGSVPACKGNSDSGHSSAVFWYHQGALSMHSSCLWASENTTFSVYASSQMKAAGCVQLLHDWTEYSRTLMCTNLDVEDFDLPCSPSLKCSFPLWGLVPASSLGCPVGLPHPPAIAMSPQLSQALSFRKWDSLLLYLIECNVSSFNVFCASRKCLWSSENILLWFMLIEVILYLLLAFLNFFQPSRRCTVKCFLIFVAILLA